MTAPLVQESDAPALTILIVHPEKSTPELYRAIATDCGCKVLSASTSEEALSVLNRFPVDIVVSRFGTSDSNSPGLLTEIREKHPEIAIFALRGDRNTDSAPEYPYDLTKQTVKVLHPSQLHSEIRRIIESPDFVCKARDGTQISAPMCGFARLIGTSTEMQRVYRLITRVSRHLCPVLILGESGTGKELVAQSIHFSGPRRERSFVPVDCSSLAPTLIESELFGHVKGAFTGAYRSKPGLVQSAEGGTLFLDEIGDLPLDLQSKLLRIVQENEVRPLGSNQRLAVSVRVIAATNRNIEQRVRDGMFRQDLYFRLNVVQLTLPPLRERKTDIPLLVNHFLEKFSRFGGGFSKVSDQALELLLAYDWPGNVRELENAIEYASALGAGPILQAEHLPLKLHDRAAAPQLAEREFLPLDELERRAILLALRETRGDKTAAARMLGIGKSTLYRRLRQLDEPRSSSLTEP